MTSPLLYELEVKRPGSLLSVVLRREITPAQLSIIVALLKDDGLTYGEALAFLASRRPWYERKTEEYGQ